MLDQTEPSLIDEIARDGRPQGSPLSTTPLPPLQTIGQQPQYVVHLPIFEGPLDLLLHLIEKRQMEITTISLVAVTDQYLAYLQQWQEPVGAKSERGGREDLYWTQSEGLCGPSLANMAAFISIAARLLFIKSQSLLPQTSKDEMAGEEGEWQNAAAMAEELRTHLLEYKFAKEIAQYLRQREEAGLQTYGRSGLLAGIEAQLAWTPPTLVGLEAQSLTQAFQRLLKLRARDEANGAELLPLARVRVSDRIAEIVGLLSKRPSIRLTELIEHESSRLVIVVTFLAVLEMWKRERICVKQETLFSPITLERGVHWSEEEQTSEE